MDNVDKQKFDLYKDIQLRTGGELYLGVIGPVRTGKSTLIKRIMDLLVLPNLPDSPEKMRILDEMPQSGSGKTITTTEPKFLPKEAFELNLSDEIHMRVRLIDCVGYMIRGAVGHLEDDQPRMVKTPWSEEMIPFVRAAEIGTEKVMQEHSTIGIVVACDGSFSEIPRENYIEAEQRTVEEMKKLGKPFVIVLNSSRPYAENVKDLAAEMEQQYEVPVLPLNCEQLRKEDILWIFEKILKEFPLTELSFYVPEWVELLSGDLPVKADLLENVKKIMNKTNRVQDITGEKLQMESEFINKVSIRKLELSKGTAEIVLEIDEKYYYEMLSDLMGEPVAGEYELIAGIKELSAMKKEYIKVQTAVNAVRQKGYGVVMPQREEIELEEPSVVKQGNKYGVKIKGTAPSLHMIRANIETEITPLAGTEGQAEDLLRYIHQSAKEKNSIWDASIFGKTIEELVEEGMKSKIYRIGEENQQKLQETMQKIVNSSGGGMVCIIL